MNQTNLPANILVVGTAQDGGYPHTGCSEACCRKAWMDESRRLISSLAVCLDIDYFLIDITPDFKYQYHMIENHLNKKPHLSGIFITHAHFGHYMGLLELGLEVMNTDTVPVYVMPKMKLFLEKNAPFAQFPSAPNLKADTATTFR